ncbi:hypothetical protein KIN20_020317 [Parelaphostrongylus tenuis]|uniref:Uncharacterized protein n=1 Tax=Parelaphostrongylus tenuis TaxID=148309 RepID=A0AAD5N332_PARTN|nr:hypothetical protein KIN20_020317 [Parelaphostrongylus tenuis]
MAVIKQIRKLADRWHIILDNDGLYFEYNSNTATTRAESTAAVEHATIAERRKYAKHQLKDCPPWNLTLYNAYRVLSKSIDVDGSAKREISGLDSN